jgi:hypothetical protein
MMQSDAALLDEHGCPSPAAANAYPLVANIKSGLIVFLLFFLSYAYFSSATLGVNTISRIALTANIVQEGKIDLGDYAGITNNMSFSNQKYYSDKAPGMSFLALPVAYLYTRFVHVAPISLEHEEPSPERTKLIVFIYLCSLATSGLITALAAALLFSYIREKTGQLPAALAGALTYGLATPTWGWAASFLGHSAAGALLIGGFILFERLAEATEKRYWQIAAAGLTLGLAITVEFTAAVPVAIIFGYAMLVRMRVMNFRSTIPLLAAVGAVVVLCQAPLLIYGTLAFGGPFEIGYSYVVGFEGMKHGFFGINLPDLTVLYEIVFGTRRGILWLSPVLIFAVAGAVQMLRFGDMRLRGATILGIASFYLLMNAGYSYWQGGWSTGPRHITPMFPFLALALGLQFPDWPARIRAIAAGVLGLSVFISLACVSVTMNSSLDASHPLFELILPAFFKGDIEQSILHKIFGVQGPWQLIPLLLIWFEAGLWLLGTSGREKAGCLAPT